MFGLYSCFVISFTAHARTHNWYFYSSTLEALESQQARDEKKIAKSIGVCTITVIQNVFVCLRLASFPFVRSVNLFKWSTRKWLIVFIYALCFVSNSRISALDVCTFSCKLHAIQVFFFCHGLLLFFDDNNEGEQLSVPESL